MNRIYLGLAIHNHQPVGNFPWVFEQAYKQAYLPMLESLERHGAVRLSLHYSGCLYDWLEAVHPEFLSRLARLVERGQVEIMGGAYYEPILPSIPDADKVGQIAKMNMFIKGKFGVVPRGFWLAERVWEPHLAKILAEAGMELTLVDGGAFKSVGLKQEALFGYYVTEEQGKQIMLFPISKLLRYSIPWRKVSEVVDYLKERAIAIDGGIAVMGDDGEKFGVWPGTYKLCWQDGWIEEFFTELEANREWLCTVPLGEYTNMFPPVGRIYLPCASYDEMMEWSLPASDSWQYSNLKKQLEIEGREDIKRYMYCGLWRNFLVKYPEVNRMYRKMLAVHRKVHQARALSTVDCGLEELWKAQCNCPYWHGIFGGIYLADIRATTYRHLIQAENKADGILRGRRRWSKGWYQGWLEWQKVDFDGDGAEEIIVESDVSSIYISPKEGGSIFEWDLRSCEFNLLSTMTRRLEAYHFALTEAGSVAAEPERSDTTQSIHDLIRIKDRDVAEGLVYDKYPRSSLLEHFFVRDVGIEAFTRGNFEEKGDFVGQKFDATVTVNGNNIKIELWREGRLWIGSKAASFVVRKQIEHRRGEHVLQVSYQLENTSSFKVDVIFGSEWNINLLGGGHNKQAYYTVPDLHFSGYLDSPGELNGVNRMVVGNHHLGFNLEVLLSPSVSLWHFPVESVSNSEGGVEKLYQASCFLFRLPLSLSPGATGCLSITWRAHLPGKILD